MRVLHVGDLVGPEATRWVAAALPAARADLALDLVVVNAENAGITGPDPGAGFGMPKELVDELLASGVDVITSGNHGFDSIADAEDVFGDERVLRPFNLPRHYPGRGAVRLEIDGSEVSVINLGGRSAGMDDAEPLERTVERLPLAETTIVDLHTDAAWEKMVFAAAMDGRVSAVLGTHTHEPTENLHILPGGTAFVCEVGMTGPSGYPGGFPLDHFASRYTGADRASLPPFGLARGPLVLGAVLLDLQRGKAVSVERVRTDSFATYLGD